VPYVWHHQSAQSPDTVLREIRSRGFTLTGFAQEVGISPQTLTAWLRDTRAIQVRHELAIWVTLRRLPVVIPLARSLCGKRTFELGE
jgi:transcriptional regulator with XRE-family HTH domain